MNSNPECIDDAIKSGLFGGFKATLTCNYMKELLNIMPTPMLKGVGGLSFNMNLKLKNSDIESFLENKMVKDFKEVFNEGLTAEEEYAKQFGHKNKFEAIMNLDLSNGFNAAFGITEEAFSELMRD